MFSGFIVEPVRGAAVDRRDDVLVVELARGAGLVEELLDVALVVRQALREDLDRDEAIHGQLAGLEDRAHAALADLAEDPVARDQGLRPAPSSR
jgi:hypothetical protein